VPIQGESDKKQERENVMNTMKALRINSLKQISHYSFNNADCSVLSGYILIKNLKIISRNGKLAFAGENISMPEFAHLPFIYV
jgi:hypothetical protein